MLIREEHGDKRHHLPLLLLADEQESMVDRYLDEGAMYVLEVDGIVVGECVVNDAGEDVLEIKNIAVDPSRQHQGYGRMLIDFVAKRHAGEYDILQVGTGDSPLTMPFYERCGFERSHVVEGFFTENYDHPIFEGGVQLVDMVYLRKRL